METPLCPVCQKEMVSNVAGKAKNTKAPDWKCSDRNCKFQFSKDTGTWVVSEYITAIWDEKPGTPSAYGKVAKSAANQVSENVSRHEAKKEEAMKMMASGRDAVLIVTAEMGQGSAWSEDDLKVRIKMWKDWMYNNIYNVPF